ncbi:uncharacterized protein N7484_005335 [Penicillium longicatenatum]|uniref:uncharacterized protein n=1 Tax=Penicillium longicatenatum TaxID=1561947 RepID=UPI002549ACCD|nr:uncharacterized protein N7484_005335 [Penicillium longicatenatum]KAJ5651612.1 hypothetical protein N7484_005335 [Penicillium longicatenatum]
MWRHFCGILRARGFQPPGSMTQSSPAIELPRLVPCDYPEDPSQEIDAAKRCGKPFADTRQADCSLNQRRVCWQHSSADGSLKRSLDSDGSGTLGHRGVEADSAVWDDRTNTAEGYPHDPTAPTAPYITAEAPSDLSMYSSAPIVDLFTPLIPASAGSL